MFEIYEEPSLDKENLRTAFWYVYHFHIPLHDAILLATNTKIMEILKRYEATFTC